MWILSYLELQNPNGVHVLHVGQARCLTDTCFLKCMLLPAVEFEIVAILLVCF